MRLRQSVVLPLVVSVLTAGLPAVAHAQEPGSDGPATPPTGTESPLTPSVPKADPVPVQSGSPATQPVLRSLAADAFTPISKTHQNANGTFTSTISQVPTWRPDTSGGWSPVSLAIGSQNSATFPLAAPGAYFPTQYGVDNTALAKLTLPKGTVTLSAPGLVLGAPTLSSGTVLHTDPTIGTNITLDAEGDGIATSMILASPTSPTTFHFHLADPAGQLGDVTGSDGAGFVFTGDLGHGIRASITPATAHELANTDQLQENDPHSAHLNVSKAGDGFDIVESVDATWLKGKTYPIVLDPKVAYTYQNTANLTPQSDCQVVHTVAADPKNANYVPADGKNWCPSGQEFISTGRSSSPDTLQRRLFSQFDVSNIPAGSVLTDNNAATLRLSLDSNIYATATSVDAFEEGKPWTQAATYNDGGATDSTGWTGGRLPNKALSTVLSTQTFPASSAPTVNAPVQTNWAVGNAVQDWVTTPARNFGLRLETTDETSATNSVLYFQSSKYNRFGSTANFPLLTVTFTAPAALGLENWWSTVSRPLGPQGAASVNVGNGNLVVQQVDSTPVQAHGHLAYVLRRTYNSQDQTVANLPGNLGQGWILNLGEAGLDGVGGTALQLPSTDSVTSPLAVTLVDRDGTRHLFQPKLASPMNVTSSLGSTTSVTGLRSLAALPSGYTAACLAVAYQAPAGVHLGLFRYVAVKAPGATTPCSRTAASANSPGIDAESPVSLGYVSERPDRLRSEFSANGRLLSQVDAAGVELRYVYSGGLSTAGVAVGNVTTVYEPGSCSNPTTSTCRAFRLAYNTAAGQNGSLASVTDPAGRVTTYGYDSLTSTTPLLVKVTNPDMSALNYTYSGLGGTNCSTTALQLCSATDPRGTAVKFAYTAPTGGGTAVLSTLTDRRGTATSLAYGAADTNGLATTTVNRGSERTTFAKIDPSLRAGEVQEAGIAGSTATLLRDTVNVWDKPGSTCRTPDAAVDNLLCTLNRVQTSTAPGAGSIQTTAFTYNDDGLPLVQSRRNPTGGLDVTTTGYREQYVGPNSTTVYDDTPSGQGTIAATQEGSGGTSSSATGMSHLNSTATAGVLNPTLYSLDDKIAMLPPRGNVAGTAAYPSYETLWTVDGGQNGGAGPNSVQSAGFCASGQPTGNSGLVCEQDSPSSAAAPASTDRKHDVTRYTYDSYGAKLTMLTPLAVATGSTAAYKYGYYADGESDQSGNVSAGGWLKTVTDPNGKFVAYGYDRAGNVAETWDRTATDGTNPATYPLSTCVSSGPTDPSGTARTLGACALSLHATGTLAAALASPWRYVRSTRDPVGNTTATTVDVNGNPTTVTPPRGVAAGNSSYDIVTTFDGNDQQLTRHTPAEAAGTVSTWTYDMYGNTVAATKPRGAITTTVTSYDAVNRPVMTSWTRQATSIDRPTDCAPGRVTASSDAPLLTGRVLCQTSMTYDGMDDVLTSTDAAGKNTLFAYDSLGRKVRTTAPDNGSGANSRLTQVVYDADGHVTDTCPPREFTESDASKACTATSPYSTHDAYDPAGRVKVHTTYRQQPGSDGKPDGSFDAHTTTSAYDADGNVVSVTDPNGNGSTTSFDLLDRKQAVAIPRSKDASGTVTSYSTSYAYDATGDTTTVTAPNGAGGQARVTANSYDADHRTVDSVTAADSNNASQAGPATSDGGSDVRTRTFYDADGHVVASLDPRAFATSVTSPNTDYLVRTDYDTDGRPTDTYRARLDSGNGVTDPTGDATQAGDCTTGLRPATLPAVPGYPGTAAVCRTHVSYDADGNKAELDWPSSHDTGSGPGSDGRNTTYTYTDDALLASSSDPSPTGTGRAVTTTTYEGHQQPLLVTPPPAADGSSRASLLAYYDDGSKKSQTLPGTGEVVNGTRLRPVTTWSYDADGHATSTVKVSDTGSSTTSETSRTVFLSDSLTADAIDGYGDDTRYGYDSNGNKTRVWSPSAVAKDPTNTAGTPTVNGYTMDNLLGSTLVPIDPLGMTVRRTDYGFDSAGRTVSTHTFEASSSAPTLALAGRDAGTLGKAYYPDDRLQTESGRPSTSTGESTVTATNPVSAGTTTPTITTTYDAAGNALQVTQAGASIRDNLGAAVPTGSSALTNTFYLDGLLRTAGDGQQTTSEAYDGAGQVTTRTQTGSLGTGANAPALQSTSSSYAYNLAELNTSVSSTVTGGGTGANATTLAYDPAGLLRSMQMPNGTARAYSYNPDDTLGQADLTNGTAASPGQVHLATWTYGYDEFQRVTSQQFDGAAAPGAGSTVSGQAAFTYDTADRLARYTPPAGSGSTTTKQLTYDGDGNRLSWGPQAFTYNADDTIATQTDPAGANMMRNSYFPFGGLKTDGCTGYSYDGFDRLATATTCASGTGQTAVPAMTSSYSYDGMDRRTGQTTAGSVAGAQANTTTIHYDGLSQTLTNQGVGNVATIYQLDAVGTPMAVNGTVSAAQGGGVVSQYLLDDGQGSIATAVTSTAPASGAAASSQLACTARLDPYGTPFLPTQAGGGTCSSGATPNQLWYHGAQRDTTTGQYQLGSRTYDPGRAGFLTADSYRSGSSGATGALGTDPLTRNSYTYINGDPVNGSDPSGHMRCSTDDREEGACTEVGQKEHEAMQIYRRKMLSQAASRRVVQAKATDALESLINEQEDPNELALTRLGAGVDAATAFHDYLEAGRALDAVVVDGFLESDDAEKRALGKVLLGILQDTEEGKTAYLGYGYEQGSDLALEQFANRAATTGSEGFKTAGSGLVVLSGVIAALKFKSEGHDTLVSVGAGAAVAGAGYEGAALGGAELGSACEAVTLFVGSFGPCEVAAGIGAVVGGFGGARLTEGAINLVIGDPGGRPEAPGYPSQRSILP